MEATNKLLVFSLDGCRYALRLPIVERVFRAVEIVPLPKAPEIVLGVINLHGNIVPVVDVRKRFRLPERETEPGDQLILAHTLRHPLALLVDSVSGVIEGHEQDIVAAQNILPSVEYVEGVVKLKDGIVLILDLNTFLSLDEEKRLGQVMRKIKDDSNP